MATITQRAVRNARARGLTVLTHAQWGSVHRDVYAERRRLTAAGHWGAFTLQADTLVQHITVTFDSGELTGDFREDMRTIERIGFERFRSGVSYNFVVDMKTGMVGVGQPLDSKGTHTVNETGYKPGQFSYDQNMRARAIAVMGMPDSRLWPAGQRALVQLAAAMVEEDALTAGYDYLPHSVFAEKDCPCDATRDRMPAIRKAVRKELAA